MAGVSQRDVLRLERPRYDRAKTALGRAFFDYNLMVYAAPAQQRRGPAVTLLYDAILWDCFRWGEVYATADGIGAACWLPPRYAFPSLIRQARSGMLKLPLHFGIQGFRRLLAYDAMAHALHHEFASGPHWYLSAIGVEPEFQGQGIAGALMRPILARADAEWLPCYLETHRESNVRVYEKQGFQVERRSEVAGHPVPVWAMLRRPQSMPR